MAAGPALFVSLIVPVTAVVFGERQSKRKQAFQRRGISCFGDMHSVASVHIVVYIDLIQ